MGIKKSEPAAARYRRIFGEIQSLRDPVPWTTAISSMLEWLTWDTKTVLGISKTAFRQKIVEWCTSEELRNKPADEVQKIVEMRLASETKNSEQPERYSPTRRGLLTPREALRQARYFSEDFLNKEFDIFWSLSSDRFLDSFYQQYFEFDAGGQWTCHGSGGVFANSTGISEMQPDNLSFNETANLLVGNELKLGGKKNPDQILKYAWMFYQLKLRGFVPGGCGWGLLFISDSEFDGSWKALVEREIAYCSRDKKHNFLVAKEVTTVAESMTIRSTTWRALAQQCDQYCSSIGSNAQVERKLIAGFLAALSVKKFMLESQ